MALTAQQKYYRKNKARLLEYGRDYYLKNRDYYIKQANESRKKQLAKDPLYLSKALKRRKDKDPEKFKIWSRRSWIRRRFGLTLEEYDGLLAKQNYECLICAINIANRKDYALDHCHITGNIRGFLCKRCNSGMGFFDDNPDLIMKAHNYLRERS